MGDERPEVPNFEEMLINNPIRRWFEKRTPPMHFHCIDCGEVFTAKIAFDKHVVCHQMLDICYQLQETEDMRFEFEDEVPEFPLPKEDFSWDAEFDKENEPPEDVAAIVPDPNSMQSLSFESPGSDEGSSFDSLPPVFSPPVLNALFADSDRLCSFCFESFPTELGIAGHLIESHASKATVIRVSKNNEVLINITPSATCDYCPQSVFSSDHEYFLHVWKDHIQEGEELPEIKRPYNITLELTGAEGTVGVIAYYKAFLPNGAYKKITVFKDLY